MRRIHIAGLLALVLTAAGCTEDSDGTHFEPGGDANGTWVVQRAAGTTYVRVLPTSVELYVETDTCFAKTEYAITAIDGPQFTLVQEGLPETSWTIERVGDQLSVVIGTEAMTLEPADVDLNTIAVCGGPEGDFPHAPCETLPEVEVGGSVTGVLEDGDERWTDDTWYDLYSLQLDAGATVTVGMSADDMEALDTYLMLYDAFAVDRIEDNDDIDADAGNYNSRIESLALDAGCYIIVANSYSGDDAGETGGGYAITVQ